jgi:hypothetical protein
MLQCVISQKTVIFVFTYLHENLNSHLILTWAREGQRNVEYPYINNHTSDTINEREYLHLRRVQYT